MKLDVCSFFFYPHPVLMDWNGAHNRGGWEEDPCKRHGRLAVMKEVVSTLLCWCCWSLFLLELKLVLPQTTTAGRH